MKINVYTYCSKQINIPFGGVKKQIEPIKGELYRSFRMGSAATAPALKVSPFSTVHFFNPWQLLLIIGQFAILQQSSLLQLPPSSLSINFFPELKLKPLTYERLLNESFIGYDHKPTEAFEPQSRNLSKGKEKQNLLNNNVERREDSVRDKLQLNDVRSEGKNSSQRSFSKPADTSYGLLERELNNPVLPIQEAVIYTESVHNKHQISQNIGMPSTFSKSAQAANAQVESLANLTINADSPFENLWNKWIQQEAGRGNIIPNTSEEWLKSKFSKSRKRFIPWAIKNYKDGDSASTTPCKDTFCIVNGLDAVETPNEEKLLILLSSLLKQGFVTEGDIEDRTNLTPHEIQGLWDIPDYALPMPSKLQGNPSSPDDFLRI